jgi:CRISPR-associated protein Csd1
VIAMFEHNDFMNDKKLSGEFLLGYHCQRAELWKKEDKESFEQNPINDENNQ